MSMLRDIQSGLPSGPLSETWLGGRGLGFVEIHLRVQFFVEGLGKMASHGFLHLGFDADEGFASVGE